MADEKPVDPSATFQENLTKWEREFDANANRVMGTEAYSAWMNQMQQGQLTMQKAYSDFMTQHLQSMNVPTRDDVIRIGEAVRQLDQRMERIEHQLAKLAGPVEKTSGKKRPARTKKPEPVSGAGN